METDTAPKTSTPRTSGTDIRERLRAVRAACEHLGREDLVEQLDHAGGRADAPEMRIAVVGEFKQGKSSLVNALVQREICPVEDDLATAVPTVVRHGTEGDASVTLVTGTGEELETVELSLDGDVLRDHIMHPLREDGSRVTGAAISCDNRMLGRGIVLIDTPGVGGTGAGHTRNAVATLGLADAAVFVTDASQELTASELDYLRQADEICSSVMCVVTKTDFYPDWSTVVELDRGHLSTAGLDVPVVPVSSSLRMFAVRHRDAEINAESGIPDLARLLESHLDEQVRLEERRLGELIDGVLDQLIAHHRAELEAARDPRAGAHLVEQLEAARDRLDTLRSGRWKQGLADGITDLRSEVDFELRARIKDVSAEADSSITLTDPAEVWSEFEAVLVDKIAAEVDAVYRMMLESAGDLAGRIALDFDDAGVGADPGRILDIDVADPTDILARATIDDEIDLKTTTSMGAGLTLLRSSYSGVLMFTMLGSMASLSAVAVPPLAIGAGLVFGRKGLRDESERLLTQRRAQARMAMKRYCDDVGFHVGKDTRDTLNRLHRTMRDAFQARADSAVRSAREAQQAADIARRQDAETRKRRAAELAPTVARLEALRAS